MELYEIQWKVVQNGLRPEIPQDCDPLFKELMELCWKADPSARPEFKFLSEKLGRLAIQLAVADEDPTPPNDSDDLDTSVNIPVNNEEYKDDTSLSTEYE